MDYYEIDDVRFYFLKVPYQIIKELHKTPFQKLKQPRSKKNVNNVDDVIGFHFIRKPEVKAEIEKNDKNVNIIIKEFKSKYHKDDDGVVLENFESLSAIFIDKDYNGESFVMDDVYFADELLSKKIDSGDEKKIRSELKGTSKDGLKIKLKSKDVGTQIMVVYTDIYGNDFTEVYKLN